MLAAIARRGPDDDGILIAPPVVATTGRLKRGLHLPSLNLIVKWILRPRPPAAGRENIAALVYVHQQFQRDSKKFVHLNISSVAPAPKLTEVTYNSP
jgi:hypothetical protein